MNVGAFPASSALVLNDKKEQASHPAFVEIRPDAMPEEESTVFRPDVIIRSGNLVMEISNTASEELIQRSGDCFMFNDAVGFKKIFLKVGYTDLRKASPVLLP